MGEMRSDDCGRQLNEAGPRLVLVMHAAKRVAIVEEHYAGLPRVRKQLVDGINSIAKPGSTVQCSAGIVMRCLWHSHCFQWSEQGAQSWNSQEGQSCTGWRRRWM